VPFSSVIYRPSGRGEIRLSFTPTTSSDGDGDGDGVKS
jgi:hypothetical protein